MLCAEERISMVTAHSHVQAR